jgi:hypothetical protein
MMACSYLRPKSSRSPAVCSMLSSPANPQPMHGTSFIFRIKGSSTPRSRAAGCVACCVWRVVCGVLCVACCVWRVVQEV